MRRAHSSPLPRGERDLASSLLVFLALALALGTGQPPHVHADGGVGLYNESHVLAPQGTLTGGAVLSVAASERWTPPARPLALPDLRAVLPGPCGRTAASRAPPLP